MAVNWMLHPSLTGIPSEIRLASTGPRVLRVLAVDDEQGKADELARRVLRAGHEVQTAGDAVTAFHLATVQRPDVVLLDVDLNEPTGWRLARQLRREFSSKACLIIAVIGRPDDERRKHCLEAGIDLLVVKPIQASVLETLLLLECVHVNRSRRNNGLKTNAASDSLVQGDWRLNTRTPRKCHTLTLQRGTRMQTTSVFSPETGTSPC